MKLLLATSEFCGPCQLLKRWLIEEKLEVEIINMEDNIDSFRKYDIRSVPTLLILENEELFEKIQGNNHIINKIKEYA